MSSEQIFTALRELSSPSSTSQREQAESFIKACEEEPGFGRVLFEIIKSHDVPLTVKQLSSILLKNLSSKWAPVRKRDAYFSEGDKEMIKGEILEVFANVHYLVRCDIVCWI